MLCKAVAAFSSDARWIASISRRYRAGRACASRVAMSQSLPHYFLGRAFKSFLVCEAARASWRLKACWPGA